MQPLSPSRRVLLAALVLATAGCTAHTPTPTTPTPPPTIQRWSGLLGDTREIWSAENGIDLLTGPAVVIRAYRESIDLAQAMGNVDYVYPGFAGAVLPNEPDGPVQAAWDRWPAVTTPDTESTVGNRTSHILTVNRSGRDVTAVVCSYVYATAKETAPGRYVSRGGAPTDVNRGIDAYLVEMTAPDQDSSLPPQKGPEPAPLDDVFGGWKITGSLNTYAYSPVDLAREWPTNQTDLASCVSKAPDPPERRQFLNTGEHPRSDFPTLPATPGWPAEPR
jgi:hypothetical protein